MPRANKDMRQEKREKMTDFLAQDYQDAGLSAEDAQSRAQNMLKAMRERRRQNRGAKRGGMMRGRRWGGGQPSAA